MFIFVLLDSWFIGLIKSVWFKFFASFNRLESSFRLFSNSLNACFLFDSFRLVAILFCIMLNLAFKIDFFRFNMLFVALFDSSLLFLVNAKDLTFSYSFIALLNNSIALS
jgi:hypothetical protein